MADEIGMLLAVVDEPASQRTGLGMMMFDRRLDERDRGQLARQVKRMDAFHDAPARIVSLLDEIRLARIKKYVAKTGTFMLTYGDGLSDVNVAKLWEFHRAHGKKATLTTIRPTSRFGVINLGSSGAVEQFNEKPVLDSWINAGYFVFHRRVFEYLGGDDCVLEREPLEKLARDGELHAYRHDGFFFAMDTYREYKALNDMWGSGAAPWKAWS